MPEIKFTSHFMQQLRSRFNDSQAKKLLELIPRMLDQGVYSMTCFGRIEMEFRDVGTRPARVIAKEDSETGIIWLITSMWQGR